MITKAVFLDKDGTLIDNHPFHRGTEHIEWMPGTIEGLRFLHRSGYALIVVSNQEGIAHGWFTVEDLLREQIALRAELASFEIPLAGFYYCPHHSRGVVPLFSVDCYCRKPHPGMLIQASGELKVDLNHCWMVGDILNDVEAGRGAGCRTILLTNGNETEWNLLPSRWPDFIADNVLEAARLITLADLTANDEESCSQDDGSTNW